MDIKVKSQKKLKLETHFFRYIFFIGCPVCWQLNKYQTKKKRSSNKQPLRCSLAGAVEPIFKAPSETQTRVPTPLAVLNHLHWRDTSIQGAPFPFPQESPLNWGSIVHKNKTYWQRKDTKNKDWRKSLYWEFLRWFPLGLTLVASLREKNVY